MADLPNIVLVHGAWADGSCWSGVIRNLQADGYDVIAPQLPHTSLDEDVARVRQVLARLEGPTVIAGHSFGGQVLTALGADLPNVKALVYVAAFGLDEGESIGQLLAGGGEPPAALAHLDIDAQGSVWLPRDDFVGHFAADLPAGQAAVMFAVQQPLAASTLEDVIKDPAWKHAPTWFVVAKNDEAIPADGERLFAARMGATTVEIESSHVVMTSHPDEVADVIKQAAAA
jgi:pimeloyl-ACP methyl ester carboxylesterase